MKKVSITLLFLLSLILISCEEVVQLDMDTAPPRLVVDASINWEKGSKGEYQFIWLSTTTGFYNNTTPKVSGATVFVTNSKGDIFNFSGFKDTDGLYACDHFVPEMSETYTLTVIHEDETYTATETMLPVPQLLNVTQEVSGSITNKDIITVKAYFDDPVNETNFYMNRFIKNDKSGQSGVFDDRFVNGNLTYTVRIFDDLAKSDKLRIELYGISSQYYDYMSKIFSMISEGNVGPFEVPPSQVRGNVINQSNASNFAYGYFRLSEVSTIEYITQ